MERASASADAMPQLFRSMEPVIVRRSDGSTAILPKLVRESGDFFVSTVSDRRRHSRQGELGRVFEALQRVFVPRQVILFFVVGMHECQCVFMETGASDSPLPKPSAAEASFAAAMVKQKVDPAPSSDSTQIVPPWPSTIFLQTAKPRPVPGIS